MLKYAISCTRFYNIILNNMLPKLYQNGIQFFGILDHMKLYQGVRNYTIWYPGYQIWKDCFSRFLALCTVLLPSPYTYTSNRATLGHLRLTCETSGAWISPPSRFFITLQPCDARSFAVWRVRLWIAFQLVSMKKSELQANSDFRNFWKSERT